MLTIILCGCAKNDEESVYLAESEAIMQSEDRKAKMSPNAQHAEITRKIIKQGEITFETASVSDTKTLLQKVVSENKGYISNENVSTLEEKIEHRIILRIPAEKFEFVLDQISKSAQKIDSKNIDAQDVTEEYIDIEARLKVKHDLENRYRELLKQATKVEEMVNIEREIGNLRSEIESIEGRLKYLSDNVSFSTLTVVYYEKSSPGFNFGSKFNQGIKGGWNNLMWFLILLVNLWPFLLLAATIVIIATWFQRRRRKNKM